MSDNTGFCNVDLILVTMYVGISIDPHTTIEVIKTRVRPPESSKGKRFQKKEKYSHLSEEIFGYTA
jgi:hypothetical protein